LSLTRPAAPLALRIWVVSALSVVAGFFGLILVFRLVATEPHPRFRTGAYAAEKLAQRWGDEAALRAEVDRLAELARLDASVHRWDGTRVTGTREAAPLSDAERATVARDGRLESGVCFPGPCREAIRLGPAAAPVGYVVLAPIDRPSPMRWLPITVTLLGLAFSSALLGAWLARPLQRLAGVARALGAGDLAARTGIRRRDELGDVARAFDEMAERLVATLRGQTELLANVAHELRTPLARIRVALDLAAEGDAAEAREALGEIAEDLAELERLVADILASARLELGTSPGAPPLRLAPVDLAEVARAAADRLRQRAPERAVEVDAPGPLPVEGDAALLRRVLDNLLDNARKYSRADAPIRVAARADGGGAVRVSVTDAGAGIAPEDLGSLFTPFFRADRSRNRATGGVGLGLSLSRRIAEAHRGGLAVESAPGRGSTFTLSLPARRPEP
jgi:two-component system, OmpR family, sensor kinase